MFLSNLIMFQQSSKICKEIKKYIVKKKKKHGVRHLVKNNQVYGRTGDTIMRNSNKMKLTQN